MSEVRVLFLLLNAGAGSEANRVIEVTHAMRQLGADAQFAAPSSHSHAYERSHRHLGEDMGAILHDYEDEGGLVEHGAGFDAVVATGYASIEILERIVEARPGILPAYYVQDHEPRLLEEGSPERRLASDAYRRIPGAVLFAETRWVRESIEREHGVEVASIPPGVDLALFHPPVVENSGGKAVRVAAVAHPSTPDRGHRRAMRVLKRLRDTLGEGIEIDVFHSDSDVEAPRFESDFAFEDHGALARGEIASLLRRADVFADLSYRQPFAHQALEAMACGCATVIPEAGGAAQVAVDRTNALVVDTASEDECYMRIAELIVDPVLRRKLGAYGIDDALQYPIIRTAASQLAILGSALAERGRGRQPGRSGYPRPLAGLIPRCSGATPGSSYVRVLQPLSHPRATREVALDCPPLDRLLCGRGLAEAVLIQRTAITPTRVTSLLGHLQRTQRPLIFELDDDLLLLEADSKYREELDGVRRLLEAAALVTVATPNLERAIAAHTSAPVTVIPNSLDERLWFAPDGQAQSREAAFRHRGETASAPQRILYMGTTTHSADLKLLQPAIEALRDDADLDVELEVIGGEPPSEGQHWYQRLEVPWGHVPYPHFVRWLTGEADRWDLAVAPLEDSEFNRSKSDIKLLEYSALGLPSVVSDVEAYRDARDGEDAVLVGNSDSAWAEAIAGLCRDADRRASIARAATKRVREARCLDTSPTLLAEAITRAL